MQAAGVSWNWKFVSPRGRIRVVRRGRSAMVGPGPGDSQLQGPRLDRTDRLGWVMGGPPNWICRAGRLERLAWPTCCLPLVCVFFCRRGDGGVHSIGAGAASWAVVRKPHCRDCQLNRGVGQSLGSAWVILGPALPSSRKPIRDLAGLEHVNLMQWLESLHH